MTNYELIEKFFEDYKHKGNSEYYSKQHGSLTYVNNVLYSYATCIGEIVKDIRGGDVLLISDYRFSQTTGRHLSYLSEIARKQEFLTLKMAGLYGASEFDPRKIINYIERRLADYAQTKISRETSRLAVLQLCYQLQYANDIEKFTKFKDIINELLEKYADMFKLALKNQNALVQKRLHKSIKKA
jgi:hypothetical protein